MLLQYRLYAVIIRMGRQLEKNEISTIEQLREIYGEPGETSLVKVTDCIIDEYARLIEASPFVAVATSGNDGLDCSPRGDRPGFVRIADNRTLLMPDRKGNNRVDTLENIIADGRIGLLFLIPGSGTTLRVNGKARLSVDRDLCHSFAVDGQLPRSVIVITVEAVYFQCARAIVRSRLWDAEQHVDPKKLPTPGQILAVTSQNRVGGQAYDDEWPQRAAKSLW